VVYVAGVAATAAVVVAVVAGGVSPLAGLTGEGPQLVGSTNVTYVG
jgi:hypothetical protein